MARVYIGTSGWVYKEWGKKFFPKDLSLTKHLSFLAEHFNSVEINASFYRLQPPHCYEKWRRSTPRDFRFAVKVSRFITHIKLMKAVRAPWKRFLKTTLSLKNKRGPYLCQFPWSFTGKEEEILRIERFLQAVKKNGRLRLAFEFRHEGCFSKKMLETLERHRAALVFANPSKYPTAPLITPADFVYFRLHGPRRMFASGYSDEELRPWAKLIKKYLKQGKDAYVYFNNDMHAPANAKVLQRMVGANPPPL